MTKDNIIRIAREADFKANLSEPYCLDHETMAWLERFANLVAVVERESCAAICEEEEELRDRTPFDCALRIRARGNT